MPYRVAITGLGLVCALGRTLRESWPRILAGEHGIGPISRFDASRYPASLAAEVRAFELPGGRGFPPTDSDHLRRGSRFFVAAALEARADAGLTGPRTRPMGVAAGVSASYLHMAQLRELWRCRDPLDHVDVAAALAAGIVPSWSLFRRDADTMAAAAATALGARGPRVTIDTACAAGAHAIADAFRMIARGDAPAMLAGGGSGLIVPVTLLAFGRLGALTPSRDPATASRPFDRHRDGFVLGEGAAALILERLDDALARGARVYAEVAGAATSVNAHSLVEPSPDGEMEAATIAAALDDAGLAPADVDYIAAHGTSTPRNDAVETQAIKRALGARAREVAVSSHKGQLGHTLPAAGAINAVMAAMALATQVVPPTAHLVEADPACDLDYVPGTGRPARVRAALVHAFAFGGQNAVLALRGASDAQAAEEAAA